MLSSVRTNRRVLSLDESSRLAIRGPKKEPLGLQSLICLSANTMTGALSVQAYSENLADLGFSFCGQYIHGKEGRNLVVLPLASLI